MTCEQARKWFDGYLDGELPPSLDAEFRSHCRGCPDCCRELALLEVTWDVIAAEPDETSAGLSRDFSERLLSCLPTAAPRRSNRMRSLRVWGPGLAVAAMLTFAVVVPSLSRGPKGVKGPAHGGAKVDLPDQGLKIDRFHPELWVDPFNLNQPFPALLHDPSRGAPVKPAAVDSKPQPEGTSQTSKKSENSPEAGTTGLPLK